jgi:large conductance mechanosensitive channel
VLTAKIDIIAAALPARPLAPSLRADFRESLYRMIGALTGGFNFDEYFLPLSGNVTSTVLGEAQKQGAVLAYGAFITVVINFLLVAFVLFQLVKISNRMKKAEPAPPPAGPTKSEELLAEIRDALRSKPSA